MLVYQSIGVVINDCLISYQLSRKLILGDSCQCLMFSFVRIYYISGDYDLTLGY